MADELIYSTRRELLTGTLATLSLSATIPGFLYRTALAMAQGPEKGDGRILVVVQLAGGNDGLNTIIPFAMDSYYKARPGIAIPKKELRTLNDEIGIHPAATALHELYGAGRLAIIQGVGYPNPNRSHFKSMDVWHLADPTGRSYDGWLGRYFDSCCQGQDPPVPQSGISLTDETPLAMIGDRFMPLTFEDESKLAWKSRKSDRAAEELFEKLNSGAAATAERRKKTTQDETLDFLRRTALEARMGAADIQEAARGGGGGAGAAGRRQQLSQQLQLVARMIAAEFPTRVYYLSLGGFDTHSNQLARQQQLLRELGDALQGFVKQLDEMKLLDRVLVMSFSEFGRRVNQNASGGTDHGAAAPMFLIGENIKPGLHLEHPSLEKLDEGDLIFNCDFRRIYATVLKQWLKADDRKILRGSFTPLELLKTK
ncbi:MAG: hypothetical protein HJJLKODD_01871 [Phycisphaerae bacterium]|nr:hypothetical protein [Phycisphaerae bacterium]